MTNGTIKFFNATKGFGFITPEDGSKDVFVPAVSVTASGISALKPGQLVSFDTEPDSKGPKAVNLKLLADAPRPVSMPAPMPVKERAVAPQMQDAGPPRITLFHDPASVASPVVLAALRDAGQDPRLVDYIATPPDRDTLKNLSLLSRGGDQSLVRKYDPLFLELRLDDRFISDGEFWAAIVEHPSLINGPILATAQKARVCRSENAVKSFLGIDTSDESRTAAKPKGIPGAIAMAGAPAPAVKEEEVRKTEKRAAEKILEKLPEKTPEKSQEKRQAKPPQKVPAPAPKASKTEAKVKAKTKSETKAKPAAKPKAKPAAKATKAPRKPAPKPVKKAKRAKK